jgi:hypothetical protein
MIRCLRSAVDLSGVVGRSTSQLSYITSYSASKGDSNVSEDLIAPRTLGSADPARDAVDLPADLKDVRVTIQFDSKVTAHTVKIIGACRDSSELKVTNPAASFTVPACDNCRFVNQQEVFRNLFYGAPALFKVVEIVC